MVGERKSLVRARGVKKKPLKRRPALLYPLFGAAGGLDHRRAAWSAYPRRT